MSENIQNKLENELLNSISFDELSDFLKDDSEILIDSLLKDGLLKEIPIIKAINSVVKTGMAIRDLLFIHKVVKFLTVIGSIPKEERLAFGKKMDTDSKYRHKVGETLIIALDRLDDMKKSEYLAKLFIGVIKGIITNDTFKMLSFALDKAYISDIEAILYYYKNGETTIGDSSIWERLYSTGLMNITVGVSQIIDVSGNNPGSSYSVSFYPNSNAKLFSSLINTE
jgi:hypothetical protein